jgi:Na+-translocating ferredoxin:NAD+ oxidoreductase RnfG subunit
MTQQTEVKAGIKDEIKEEIKDAVIDSIKDVIKESATSEQLQKKLGEVIEQLKTQGIVKGYLTLSDSRQKYVLAGIALVVGLIGGAFAHDWIMQYFA